MRSFFELLIATATRTQGTMKERVEKISFLTEQDHKKLLTIWSRLNGWAHPYGRWLKKVCPVYVAHKPVYHPELCDLCRKELTDLVDLLLAISIGKYKIKPSRIIDIANQHNMQLEKYELLSNFIRK